MNSDGYRETDANTKKMTARQIRSDRIRLFPERLHESMKQFSVREFARMSGLSEGVMRSYLRGRTFPTLDRLDAIANAADVTPGWLATGEGSKSRSDEHADEERAAAQTDTIVDAEMLEDIFIVLRQHQDETGRRFSVQGEARLVAEIYQYLIEEEQPTAEDRARTLRLIRAVLGGTDAQTSTAPGHD